MDNFILTDALKAAKLLKSENYTCVLVKNNTIHTSNERGVKPLLEWLDKKIELNGFSAADKVVGKAAAFLYILLGIKEVYAPVMSKSAIDTFKMFNVPASFDTKADAIINRTGNGLCPMEQAVFNIDAPDIALKKIKDTLIHLQNKK